MTNNKKYDVVIKTSSTCPKKTYVLDTLTGDEGISFKTVIGTEMLRGFYPVYVDMEGKPNMYGSLQKGDRKYQIHTCFLPHPYKRCCGWICK